MPLEILSSAVVARLDPSAKALLVLGGALLVVGALFTWFWLQERKAMRVYRKKDPAPVPPSSGAGSQRTPGLTLAEEKRLQQRQSPPPQDAGGGLQT